MKRDFAVIGLGSFGSKLCLELGAQGANVVAVDLDEERVNRIAEQIPLAYCCDCTKEETLKKLELDDVDCVMTLTASLWRSERTSKRASSFWCC